LRILLLLPLLPDQIRYLNDPSGLSFFFPALIGILALFDELLEVVLFELLIEWDDPDHHQVPIDLHDDGIVRILERDRVAIPIYGLVDEVENLILLDVVVVIVLHFHAPRHWAGGRVLGLFTLSIFFFLLGLEILCQNRPSKGVEVVYLSFAEDVDGYESACKSRLRLLGLSYVLHDRNPDLVTVYVRAELIQHLDKNYSPGPSFEDEKDPLSSHVRNFFLNLSIDISVGGSLLLPLLPRFLRHVFKDFTYVEVRVQFLNPVIQHIEDFFHASLLLRWIACD
jgi:hypothetical protein